jgi:hypothetical protein
MSRCSLALNQQNQQLDLVGRLQRREIAGLRRFGVIFDPHSPYNLYIRTLTNCACLICSVCSDWVGQGTVTYRGRGPY